MVHKVSNTGHTVCVCVCIDRNGLKLGYLHSLVSLHVDVILPFCHILFSIFFDLSSHSRSVFVQFNTIIVHVTLHPCNSRVNISSFASSFFFFVVGLPSWIIHYVVMYVSVVSTD